MWLLVLGVEEEVGGLPVEKEQTRVGLTIEQNV